MLSDDAVAWLDRRLKPKILCLLIMIVCALLFALVIVTKYRSETLRRQMRERPAQIAPSQ